MNRKQKSIIVTLILFIATLSPILSIPVVYGHNPTWWDYDWNQRLELTINHTLIDDTLTNFPVLVYIDEDEVNWGDVQNNLDDIRFTGNELNELDFEIDSFTLNWDVWFWVRLPEVSSSIDTYFFMYFDNKFCVSGENAEAVWDENFVMVQHMNDATTSTITDSTSNDNDGSKKGANEPIQSAGKIGSAQDFDVIDDYIEITDNAGLQITSEITVETWLNPDNAVAGLRYFIDKENGAMNNGWLMWRYGAADNRIGFAINAIDNPDKYIISSATVVDGVWGYVTARYNGSDLDLQVDAINLNEATSEVLVDSGTDIHLGKFFATFYDGDMDEVRISNVRRSDAWIKSSYYSGSLELVIIGYHEHYTEYYATTGFVFSTILVGIFILIMIGGIIFVAKKR